MSCLRIVRVRPLTSLDDLTSRLHHTEAFLNIFSLVTDHETHATTSSSRFQHDRIAELLTLLECVILASDKPFRARHNGHASLLSKLSCYMLDTEGYQNVNDGHLKFKIRLQTFYRLWAWSNPDHPCLANTSSKVRVLGEKAISRNHSICFVLFGDIDDLIAFGVGCAISSRKQNGVIGQRDMERGCI
jgi:hypothetical protein